MSAPELCLLLKIKTRESWNTIAAFDRCHVPDFGTTAAAEGYSLLPD